jgi:hypothetical protein
MIGLKTEIEPRKEGEFTTANEPTFAKASEGTREWTRIRMNEGGDVSLK